MIIKIRKNGGMCALRLSWLFSWNSIRAFITRKLCIGIPSKRFFVVVLARKKLRSFSTKRWWWRRHFEPYIQFHMFKRSLKWTNMCEQYRLQYIKRKKIGWKSSEKKIIINKSLVMCRVKYSSVEYRKHFFVRLLNWICQKATQYNNPIRKQKKKKNGENVY